MPRLHPKQRYIKDVVPDARASVHVDTAKGQLMWSNHEQLVDTDEMEF